MHIQHTGKRIFRMRGNFMRGMAAVCLLGIFLLLMPYDADGDENPDFRAVWVSTVYQLDYPDGPTTDPQALKQQADAILDRSLELGMNAVILQVRPAADAFYPSALFPWSKYISGTVGLAPEDGFDPLAYWVEQAHARGLQLHAWINPYRITLNPADAEALPASHPARLHPEWTITDGSGNLHFNPGLPEVRELILQGAEEIAQNYAVDGLHMDDYFYPSAGFDDAAAFAAYGTGFSSIEDWRRENVNLLVREMGQRLHAIRAELSFGISPAGIWANRTSLPEGSDTGGNESYFSHYADTRKWVKEGYLDYICPQLYWYIGHPLADYETLARWWADVVRGTEVKLYIGMADYQAGNADESSPWHGIEAIRKQVLLNREIPEISGEVHFRYKLLMQNEELVSFYQEVYRGEENVPQPPEKTPQLDRANHFAYIRGSGGAFLPDQPITRAEVATILARLCVDEDGNALFDEQASYESSFYDVSPASWYAGAVGFMGEYGLLSGYPDGSFRPEQAVTRAEFAVLAKRFLPQLSGMGGFPDLPQDHFAAQAVGALYGAGYLSGYPDGTFRPDSPITRAEAVKIINRILGRDAQAAAGAENPFADLSPSHWAYLEVLEAAVGHTYQMDGEQERWEALLLA